MKSTFDTYSVPNIRFAAGCSAQLADVLKSYNLVKPLIVSDQGILQFNLLDSALHSLAEQGLDHCIYADVQADPPESNVIDALAVARENCCDSVVGFGGGSSMDVAKLVAVLITGEQSLKNMYGVDQISASRVPLIHIPTTAGTGSEATNVAVITTGKSSKAGVVSRCLYADTILLDPELTLGLPPAATATTGIDAMVHAIEAYTSKRLKNPVSDMLAIKALSLMSNSIRVAVSDGTDLEARSNMLLGAMLAGQAFSNAPVGGVHALAYPLGGRFHIAHGLSNSLVLPHVLRFNAASAQALYHQILECLKVPSTLASAGQTLADYFQTLAVELEVPTALREVGIEQNDLPQLAQDAMLQQRLLVNNPREINEQQALEIYQQAF